MVDQMDAGQGTPTSTEPVAPGPHAAVFGDPGLLARRLAGELEAEAREKQADALRCWGSAAGEEATARQLARLPVGFTVFHDLRRSTGSGNLDHVVVGPTGAFVIESTAHSGDLRPTEGAHPTQPDALRRHVDGLIAQGRDLRDELEGVEPHLVICLVSGTLPGPTVELGPVVALPIAGLVDHLTRRPEVLSPPEVEAIEHHLHQRFLGFVAARDGAEAPADDDAAMVGITDPPPAPSRLGRIERIILRLTLAMLVLAFAVVGVRCGVDTIKGYSSRPTRSPALVAKAVCPGVGAGYTVQLAYPDQDHPDIVGFDVRALIGGQLWKDLGTWRSAADASAGDDDLTGIGSSTLVEVRARTVFLDGTSLTERKTTLRTPAEPC